MNGCESACPREEVSQDDVSPGPIANDEFVARGAYEPSHGKLRTKKIRPALVPKQHLFDGGGSVWRLGADHIPLDDLVARLKDGRAEPLFAVMAARAEAVRAISLGADGPRAFSLVDECECDAEGNKHPAHANIALCQFQKGKGLALDSPEFIDAHRALIELLQRNWAWTAPA